MWLNSPKLEYFLDESAVKLRKAFTAETSIILIVGLSVFGVDSGLTNDLNNFYAFGSVVPD